MNMPAVLSPETEADLEDVAVWYERQSDGLGTELVGKVRNALARIGAQPSSHVDPRAENGVSAPGRTGPRRDPNAVVIASRYLWCH
jgi:hypothetical protein